VLTASDNRISPFELESVLIEHPAVAEAAVVPSPDPLRLAIPKAFISLAGNHLPDRDTALSIFRHLRAQLAPYKRVRRLEFSDLPKTCPARSAASNCAAPKRPAGAKTDASRANSGKRISRTSREPLNSGCDGDQDCGDDGD
jgi:acyl-CoA synthetase (AMP-forming)/AMP-acid ligase II